MKKEVSPVVVGSVIAVILAVIVGLLWRSNQPNVVENPPNSSPAKMMKRQ